MQKLLAICVSLLLSGIAFGQTITVDEKVVTQSGRMAAITIKSDGDETVWSVAPPTNVDVFREYDPNPNTIKLRVLSYTNGVYYIVISSAKDKKVAQKVCTVIVGTAPDPVPVPDPTPNADAQLIKNLKAVYAADSSVTKPDELDALIALYEQGTVFTKVRKDLNSYGQLWSVFEQVAKNLGCAGKLKAVQQVIQNELHAAGIPMTAADGGTAIDRDKLIPVLQRVVGLLKQIR